MFHLVFVSLHCGESLKVAAVPTSIESMIISANLPSGAGTKYRGHSLARKINVREGTASIVMSDDTMTAPKVIIDGLRVRDVSDVSPADSYEDRRPKLVSRLRWMLDIEFLRDLPGEAALQEVSQTLSEQLSHWVECLCHKRADLAVLVCCPRGSNVGNSTSQDIMALLKRFAPRPGLRACFNQCTVVADTHSHLETVKQYLDEFGTTIDFHRVDFASDLVEQGLQVASFDLVVAIGFVLEHDSTYTGSSKLLLSALVRDHGWLVTDSDFEAEKVSTTPDFESASLNVNIEKHLTLVNSPSSNKHGATTINRITYGDKSTSRGKMYSQLVGVKDVVILMPDSPSSTLSAIRNQIASDLESHKIFAVSTTLAELATHHRKTIISLLEIETPFMINMVETEFGMLKKVCASNDYILWVGGAAKDFSPATGVLRVLRNELPQIRIPHLQTSDSFVLDKIRAVNLILRIFARTVQVFEETSDMEFAERSGQICIPRLVADDSLDTELCAVSENPLPVTSEICQPHRPLKLTVASPGAIDSLVWSDDSRLGAELPEDEVEFKVTAVPLHAADLENILGNTAMPVVGLEAFGIVTRVGSKVNRVRPGQTVVAVGQNTCTTIFRQHEELVVPVADAMSASNLAYSPLTIMTAFHILDLAQIQKGERVLVHSAGSAVAEIAVQLAKHVGAEVFVSVHSSDVRESLSRLYGISQDHIFELHETNLASELQLATNGQGVDVILNSTTGTVCQASWQCLAEFGRFIDYSLGSGAALLDHQGQVSYHRVDMERSIVKRRSVAVRALREAYKLVNEGIIGQVDNLQRFPASKVANALEWLQQKPNSNLVLLELNETAQVRCIPVKPASPELDSNACYLVVGGLGGLGPGIVTTLIECGARHILTLSRSGLKTEQQRLCVQRWQDLGCRVDTLSCDCADVDQLKSVIDRAYREGWKIKGVIQSAVVLKVRIYPLPHEIVVLTVPGFSIRDNVLREMASSNTTQDSRHAEPSRYVATGSRFLHYALFSLEHRW